MSVPYRSLEGYPVTATKTAFSILWFAGVIDARGHIDMNLRHGKPQPRLSVTTRRTDLLEYMAKHTGTQISYDHRGYEKRLCSAHCTEQHIHVVRQSAKWRVDSSRATIVLYNVQPFIVSQVAEVREALRVGLESYPAARGDTASKMKKLGWELPT
jgi:hypothetical protein